MHLNLLRTVLVFVTISLSLQVALATPTFIQESEPNGDGPSADLPGKTVLFNTNLHQALASGNMEGGDDFDYFEYYLNQGDSISAMVEQKNGVQVQLYLKDESLTVKASDTATSGIFKRISNYIAASSGNHYVICDYHSGSGNYDLVVTSNQDGFHELEHLTPSNDNFNDAEYLHQFNTTAGNLEFSGTIGTSSASDDDYYFFQMREGQTFDLSVRTFNNLTPKVELFAGNLSSIQSFENVSTEYNANFSSVAVTQPGPYYLKVSGNSGQGLLGSYFIGGNINSSVSVTGEEEPNDLVTQANLMMLGQIFPPSNIYKGSAIGSIDYTEATGTIDFFSFSGNTGDQVTISLDYLEGNLYTRLRLLNSTGGTVHVDTGYSSSNKRISSFTLPADDVYRIEVGYSSGTGSYEISLILNKNGFNEEEEFAQNDTSGSAEIIPFQTASGNLLELAETIGIIDEGDEDWYFIYLRENQNLNLSLDTEGGFMANVQLLDPNFQLVESLESTTLNDSLNFSPYQTTIPGSYYLNIKGVSGNGYHAHYTFVGNVSGEATHGFDSEPNDLVTTATPMNVSNLFPQGNILKGSAVGSIGLKENTGTIDFYKFSGNTGDQVTITLDYITGNLYTRLRLLNSTGGTVHVDTGYSSSDKRISAFTLPSDDEYRIEVGYSSGTGVYEISLVQNKEGYNEEEVFTENDSAGTAEIIPFLNASGNQLDLAEINGILDEHDEDWFFIYLRENQNLNLSLETAGGVMANVQLLDPDFQLIESLESASPNDSLAFTPYQTVNPGSYYLNIKGISGNGYHAHYTFVGNVSGEASHGFDIEPNDLVTTATPMNVSNLFSQGNILKGSAVGSIGLKENTGTIDFYKFSGNTGDQVTITLDYITGNLYTRFRLLNSTGGTVHVDTGYSSSDKRISAFTLPANDEYRIEVGYSSGTGVYEVSLVLNKDGFNEEEVFNENDTSATSEIIPFQTASGNLLNLAEINGILDEGDADWYFIYLRESQNLNLSLDTTGGLMANVQLLDPDFQIIESLESTVPNDSLVFSPFQTIVPGRYFLNIQGISGNGYHSHYTFVGNVVGEATHGFDIEPNDLVGTATALNVSQLFDQTNILKGSAVGSIGLKENTGTIDFYKFSGNVGDQVTITLDYITGNLYTRLRLLNSTGGTVHVDTGYSSSDKRISAFTLPTDDDYRIEVGYSSGTGVYEVSLVLNKDGYNEEEEFNQNNTSASAEIIPFQTATGNLLDLAEVNGILDENDEDWYFIYLRENQLLDLSLQTEGGVMANVQFLDPSFQVIESLESASPNDSFAFTPYQTSIPGSYYLNIKGISGNGYHAHYTFIGNVVGEATHGFDIEPNDLVGTATPMNLSELFPSSNVFKGSAVGSVGLKENTGTIDFYKFSGNTGDQVTITLDYITGNLYTRLRLLNSTGGTVHFDTGYSSSDKRIAAFTLPSDDEYRIEMGYSSGTGIYEVSMFLNKDAWNEQEEFTGNNNFANAEFIAPMYHGSNTHPIISTVGILDDGNYDTYQVELLEGTTLNLSLHAVGGWKPQIEFYKNQSLVQTITATSLDETIVLNYTELGNANEYDIAIVNLDNQHYHAQYLLQGTIAGDASRTVDNNSNSTFANAQSISFSQNSFTNSNEASTTGYISPADTGVQSDHYFIVPVTSGDNLNVTLNNTSSMDLDLYLVDDVNNPIVSDTANTSADKVLNDVYFASNGNLIIRVDHQTGEGVYSLQVNEANAVSPPMVATFNPINGRKSLTSDITVQITYDKNIQLANGGNIVLFDVTHNQPITEITYSNNTLVALAGGNQISININQAIRDYDPDPFTDLTFIYEPGLLEGTDSTAVIDFPNPWNFRLGDIQKAGMGETATLLLRKDQHLWAFGDSHFGESGNIEVPISAPELSTSSWWTVSVGAHHSMAINSIGELYTFGDTRRGQTAQSGNNLGIQIINPANTFIDISAGIEHSLAIRNSGQMTVTGKNNFGQLGLGDTVGRTTFTTGISGIWLTGAAGPDYSLAVQNNGSLWAWGNTSWGILNGQNRALSPVQIGSDTDWQSLAAGHRHAMATKIDKTLWVWGNNLKGQLGLGHTNPTSTPTQIASNVKAISAGASHSLYIDMAGNLYSFGRNNMGQLGLGDNNDRHTPELVNLNGESARFISAGPYSSSVIATSGNVYAFGKDTTGANPTTPVQVFSAEP